MPDPFIQVILNFHARAVKVANAQSEYAKAKDLPADPAEHPAVAQAHVHAVAQDVQHAWSRAQDEFHILKQNAANRYDPHGSIRELIADAAELIEALGGTAPNGVRLGMTAEQTARYDRLAGGLVRKAENLRIDCESAEKRVRAWIEDSLTRQREEEAKIIEWLREDYPEYDERASAMKADPEYAPAYKRTVESAYTDQAAAGVLYRLHARYNVPIDPKINAPARLSWWLDKRRNPGVEQFGNWKSPTYDYLVEPNRQARDYALKILQVDPALPALPPRDSDPLGEWQALYDWCVRAKRTMNSLRNSDSGGAESPAKEAEATASHSADFTFVNWFGTEYNFALGVQSSAIKALWEEWEKTGLGLHQSTICDLIDSERNTFRLTTAFRNHPAMGTLIQSCGDGKYRLAKPA